MENKNNRKEKDNNKILEKSKKNKNIWATVHVKNSGNNLNLVQRKCDFKSLNMHNLNDINDNCHGFQEAIYPVIALGQFFALIPVSGISSKNPRDLKFKYNSFKFLYFCIYLTSTVCLLIMTIAWMVINRFEIDVKGPLLFYVNVFIASIYFFKLAQKWPELMVQWDCVENELPDIRTEFDCKSLSAKIKLITFVMMIFALVEHCLYNASGVYRAYRCVSFNDPVVWFNTRLNPHIWQFLNYSVPLSVVIHVIHFGYAFTWSFTDLFIIVISVSLSTRLKQINNSIKIVKYQVVPEIFWETHRNYYQNFCDLLKSVDKALGWLIILSFTDNLYFICRQLLNIIKPTENLVHATYFWFSLTFLITRTFAVAFCAANIYEESRKPIEIFGTIQKTCYNTEVKRFFQQIIYNKIALTGNNFFYITRQLILKIAGTVATYEIVLLQFNTGHNAHLKIEDICA